jgi:hypothetical protein
VSTHFTLWCEGCQAEGPVVARHAGGTVLNARVPDDAQSYGWRFGDAAETQDAWCRFLIDHQYHDLRLLTEQRRPDPPPPPAEVGADFQPVVTHLIPPDDASPRTRTLCCDRAVMVLSRGEHVTVHAQLVTCPGNPNPAPDGRTAVT